VQYGGGFRSDLHSNWWAAGRRRNKFQGGANSNCRLQGKGGSKGENEKSRAKLVTTCSFFVPNWGDAENGAVEEDLVSWGGGSVVVAEKGGDGLSTKA